MPDDPKHGSPFNGSSLSALTGANPKATIRVDVDFPASSFVEVNDQIARLRRTGQLITNYHNGKALSLRWSSSKEVTPPDI